MKPYIPSGKTEEGAHLALIVTVLVTALVVGGLANLIGQWIRLLILFPAAMGGLVGAAALQIALAKKMRTPALVIAVAAIGGFTVWFTDFGIDYLRNRGAWKDSVALVAADLEQQGLGTPDDADIDRTVDVALVHFGRGWEITPVTVAANLLNEPLSDDLGNSAEPEPDPSAWQAFAGHVKGLADEGTSISDVGRADDATNIGSVGTYMLWIFELLIAVGVAGAIGWEQARQPFCERCKQWFQRQERLVAVAPGTQAEAVIAAMEGGRERGLAEAWTPFDTDQPFIALGIRRCEKCASGQRFVEVVRLTPKKNKVVRKRLRKGLVESGKLDTQLEHLGRKAQEFAAQAEGQT
jgi:hypothetical protein